MKDFKPLSDEDAQAAVDAVRQHGSQRAAARALKICNSTLGNRLKRAAERGLAGFEPVMPGFVVKQVSSKDEASGAWIKQTREPGEEYEVPVGHRIKGESAMVDADGRVTAKWIKTREDDLDPAALVEWIKAAFADYQPSAPVTAPPAAFASKLLTLIPLADWHIGMFAWHRETGENWDTKIAEQTIGDGIDDLISRTAASGHCVVLGGGDLIHSDNNDNKTAKSNNALQVDGRYDKIVMTACRLVVRTVEAALRRHERVTVRVLKGNHDKHASVAVAYHLLGWFRNETRVTVDVDPSLYWWMRFGKVMLGATHGDEVKIIKMPGIMAHRRPEDWGLTRYRYVHGFHLHHSEKYMTEGEGVVSEIHQAPIPQDAWHFGAGFLSGRSLQAITYHRDFGEVSRARVAILDGDKK